MSAAPEQSRYLYDALSFTSKNPNHDFDFIVNLLGIKSITWVDTYGVKGYKSRKYYNGININFCSDDPDKYLWVELSGQGCRMFESYGNGDYKKIFSWILTNPDVNITRLDIAFDDRESSLNLQNIKDSLRNGDYVSGFKTWEISDDSKGGCTIYLGSKKSDFFFRIYDKAIERGFYDRSCGQWIRFEAQLRHDRAKAWIESSFQPNELLYLLSGYIRFIDTDSNDSNKSRAPLASWWDQFIDYSLSIKLISYPGIEYNLSNLSRYVFNQAGASTYAAIEVYGLVAFLRRLKETSEENAINNPKYNQFFRNEVKQWAKKSLL